MQDAKSEDLFKAMQQKVPAMNNTAMYVFSGTTELSDDGVFLAKLEITSNSQLYAMVQTKGGGDPQVQMLQSCPNKDVVGVPILHQ